MRPSFRRLMACYFICKDTAARKRVEGSSQGLEPVLLLKGDAIPSADEVARQIKMKRARTPAATRKPLTLRRQGGRRETARRISLTREDMMAAAAWAAAAPLPMPCRRWPNVERPGRWPRNP